MNMNEYVRSLVLRINAHIITRNSIYVLEEDELDVCDRKIGAQCFFYTEYFSSGIKGVCTQIVHHIEDGKELIEYWFYPISVLN